jgi:hypothetical protein
MTATETIKALLAEEFILRENRREELSAAGEPPGRRLASGEVEFDPAAVLEVHAYQLDNGNLVGHFGVVGATELAHVSVDVYFTRL